MRQLHKCNSDVTSITVLLLCDIRELRLIAVFVCQVQYSMDLQKPCPLRFLARTQNRHKLLPQAQHKINTNYRKKLPKPRKSRETCRRRCCAAAKLPPPPPLCRCAAAATAAALPPHFVLRCRRLRRHAATKLLPPRPRWQPPPLQPPPPPPPKLPPPPPRCPKAATAALPAATEMLPRCHRRRRAASQLS
jgi:hypothetical protein